MKKLEEIRKQTGLLITDEGNDGLAGWLFLHGAKGKPAVVVVSWGGDWEHVSVSYANRVPTWEEMCRVKDICSGARRNAWYSIIHQSRNM